MQLDLQSQRPGFLKHQSHFSNRECNTLAKTVNRVDQAFGMSQLHAWQHDVSNIVSVPPFVGGRQSVGGEITCLDANRPQHCQPPCGTQHVEFTLNRKTIAGLDFNRCHTLAQQLVQTGQGRLHQFVHTQSIGRSDR